MGSSTRGVHKDARIREVNSTESSIAGISKERQGEGKGGSNRDGSDKEGSNREAKAGSNMERYGEVKRRFKALGALDDGDEEEWGAISRLYDEAIEDGEKWFLWEE